MDPTAPTLPTLPLKAIWVTAHEADLLLDAYKVTTPMTRNLVLKCAGCVLEFEADRLLSEAQDTLAEASNPPVIPRACGDAS